MKTIFIGNWPKWPDLRYTSNEAVAAVMLDASDLFDLGCIDSPPNEIRYNTDPATAIRELIDLVAKLKRCIPEATEPPK